MTENKFLDFRAPKCPLAPCFHQTQRTFTVQNDFFSSFWVLRTLYRAITRPFLGAGAAPVSSQGLPPVKKRNLHLLTEIPTSIVLPWRSVLPDFDFSSVPVNTSPPSSSRIPSFFAFPAAFPLPPSDCPPRRRKTLEIQIFYFPR